eukprot:403360910
MSSLPILTTFKSLNLDNWIIKNLEEIGIKAPTQIQIDSLPHILKGKNIIGCAQTGSGKTACFALPMLQKLAADPYGVFGLILAPSRELCMQIKQSIESFVGQNMNIRVCVLVGGVDYMKQIKELQEIPHIIIACPGRMVHYLDNDHYGLKDYLQNLQFLVFDEADRMLTEDTMKSDLVKILEILPNERQTLLFSATMVQNYDRNISKNLIFGEDNKREMVGIGNTEAANEEFQKTVQNLDQKIVFIPENVKEAYLIYLLKNQKLKKQQQCIIFTSTCKNCHFLAMLLQELEFDATFIHSQLNQRKRLNNLARFKSNYTKIIVATDVASRGLDMPLVQTVINFDIPKNPKDYVHRVGRTARAGRGGNSVSLVTQYDIDLILACEKYVGIKIDKLELNEKEVLDDINHIMKVMQVVRIKMAEQGINDMFEEFKEKKSLIRDQRKGPSGAQQFGLSTVKSKEILAEKSKSRKRDEKQIDKQTTKTNKQAKK